MAYSDLASATYASFPDDARVIIHKGLAAREVEGAYDTTLLQQAIEQQADALAGLAQVRLGRMLFELPSILGGDFQAAISLFEQAVEIDPQNMQALYYLAEVYEQELEEEKAAATMARMLAVEPAKAQLQMSADMLRLAGGLAQRINKVQLSAELVQKRNELLAANTALMPRTSVAVGGHGGEHPLTGE
ncbi:MAG: tetratricopeptide repeat protein [Gammaproteobacteria bacterium]|nr:tetratricopeptide repeat protein [Gammaproteobacteria bacterium]